jgi:outer membrane protein assembly factor BamD (BamD/ComL family)
MSLFGQALPLAAQAFLGAFFQNLFFFTMMNLMGYLILQYPDRVGYAPETLADQDDGWGELLDPVDEDIEAGNYGSAAQRLRSLIREHPDHAIALRQQRHQVLKLTDDEDAQIDNAGTLLSELIDANRLREATEVFIDITDIDPALRPVRETDYEPLMNMLVQRGEYRRAVRMANGFHKDFPESTSIPPLYLEVARIFSDFLQQPDRARQVADFLIQRFPDHPASGRAKTLRDALTN